MFNEFKWKNLKNLKMRRYIDEFMDSNSNLIYSYYDIKNKVLQLNSEGKSVDEIIKFLQDWLYLKT